LNNIIENKQHIVYSYSGFYFNRKIKPLKTIKIKYIPPVYAVNQNADNKELLVKIQKCSNFLQKYVKSGSIADTITVHIYLTLSVDEPQPENRFILGGKRNSRRSRSKRRRNQKRKTRR
jgi:hypothetical protein